MTDRRCSRAIFGAVSLGWVIGGLSSELACSGGASATHPPDGDSDGGSDANSGSDGGPDVASLKFPWDWVGIVGTGQSLSVGGLGTPVLGTKASANNLKLSLGGATVPPFDPTAATLAMVPLNEPIRPDVPSYPSAYPGNIDGETPHTVMASQITTMVQQAAQRDYITAHTVVGESGQPMTVIQKNPTNLPTTGTAGRAYDATLFEAAAISRLAGAAGKTYGIGAIIITHGESDSGNVMYENDLVRLWSDYNQDLAAITHQSDMIPMLVSQQNAVPFNAGSTSASSIAQWKVGVDHPGDLVCIGPKYQYPYLLDSSGYIHLSAHGYQLLGEKYGQVFFERVVMGRDWQPLQPTNAQVNGNVITVHFHVPVPPLLWDSTFPQPHTTGEWALGRGFEVRAASAPVTIDSVEIMGDDAVKITCRRDLTGLEVVVGYAVLTDGIARPNGGTYRWGQLRDSDPFVGATTAVPQPNYCVSFNLNAE